MNPAKRQNPAPYASHPSLSRGRRFPEKTGITRTAFQHDRDRIVHATAFRRLKGKTQVFVAHEGDHYRTRLTHSLEVSQIARSMARFLGVDEDLTEALALAHDLGHPPFGHAGERALAACMEPYGGFDHNAQTLRLLTYLEQPYPTFDGLNLTWECLEGIVKHNGPLALKEQELPWALRAYEGYQDLELDGYASLEAQLAAIADDVAYHNHDLDDGLRAGLFSLKSLKDLALVGEVLSAVEQDYPALDEDRLIREMNRRLISFMINDILEETQKRLQQADPKNVEDIRGFGAPLAGFSEEVGPYEKDIRQFLFKNMYRHYKLNRLSYMAQSIVRDLFGVFVSTPSLLPPFRYERPHDPKTPETARFVCDYIAGMTDRFALEEHARLCSPGSQRSYR